MTTTGSNYAIRNQHCPHFREVDTELFDKLFSKVAAIRSTNQELFDATHRRIEVFDQETESIFSEEEIYDTFEDTRTGNYVVVIEGNTGTGKSELCAYLSHRLRDDGRPVLHIDKNADLMSIMAEAIPRFYEAHAPAGQTISRAGNIERLQSDIQVDRKTIAEFATSKAIMNLRDAGVSISLRDEHRSDRRAFVEKKLSNLIQKGDFPTDVDFVDEEEVKKFNYLDIIAGTSPDETAKLLTDAIWDAIRDEYDSPSLDQLLEETGELFNEHRPVIVFEDWSISSLDADRLRNFMERDVETDNWDFIIAGVQDHTQSLHTQTAEDRFQFYRTNERGSSHVRFLTAETAVGFIRPYLGYIKSIDNSVTYDRNGDGEIIQIRDPEPGSLCDQCQFCDDDFRDLFPFNRIFLQRIYEGLNEENQRPRQYVMQVFKILQDYYERNEVIAPSSSSELDSLINPVELNEEVYTNEELADLATWYGSQNGDQTITVDRRFAIAAGIDDAVEYAAFGVTVDGEELVFPTTNGGTKRRKNKDRDSPDTAPDPNEDLINRLRPYVKNWRADPDNNEWSEVDVYIRRGIKDAFDRLTDGYRLRTGGALIRRIGRNKEPFAIGSESFAAPDQIEIDPQDFTREGLRELLRFGVYREKAPTTADYDRVLNAIGTQLTYYVQEWRQRVTQHELNNPNKLFSQSGSRSGVEVFTVAAYAVLMQLDDPWVEITAENLAEQFRSEESLSFSQELEFAFSEQFSREAVANVKAAFKYSQEIESLFADYFTVTANETDVRRVRSLLHKHSIFQVLGQLTKAGINRVSADIRFASKETESFQNVALALYEVGRILKEVEITDTVDLSTRAINSDLTGIDIDTIASYRDELRAFEGVDRSLVQKLDKFARVDQEDLDRLVRASERYTTLVDERSADSRTKAALVGMKVQNNEVSNRYYPFLDVNPGSTELAGLGDLFTEVSSDYVD